MLIPEMDDEIYSALQSLWDANFQRLPDHLRTPDVMHRFIWEDGLATQLFVIADKPTVVVATDICEGLNATIMLLSHEHADVGEVLRELRAIIDAFSLKRVTATVPGPVKDVQKFLEKVGFRREGHMRRATFWNNRLVGVDIWAMYADPPREQRPRVSAPRSSAAESPARPQSRNPAEPEAPAAQPAEPAA